jgi:hypothetical protein
LPSWPIIGYSSDWGDGAADYKAKRVREGEGWVDKHMEIFREQGYPWPPKSSPDITEIAETFGNRAAESVYFVNAHFKPTPGKWEFYEANHTLERNLRWPPPDGKALLNPWRQQCTTLTGQSKIVVRRLQGDSLELRALHPLEAFRLIGWDLCDWKEPIWSQDVTAELLTSLAGNAFSGFAVSPVIIASLGAFGYFYDEIYKSKTIETQNIDSDSSVETDMDL